MAIRNDRHDHGQDIFGRVPEVADHRDLPHLLRVGGERRSEEAEDESDPPERHSIT